MKNKKIYIVAIYAIIAVLLPLNVYANSSWHWVTTSPKTILPIAIIITLLIEILGVAKLNNIIKIKKVFVTICFANILSFVVPYLERAYRFIPTSGGFSISAAFNKGPYYIVLTGYLLLTLIVEIPVVYLILNNLVKNRKRLIITIIGANVLTTILVSVCERFICIGQW
jgi:hypothetical protein